LTAFSRPRVRLTEAGFPLIEAGAGFFRMTALAFDFGSGLAVRGADFAAFVDLAALGAGLTAAVFLDFGAGFLAAALGAGFRAAGFFPAGFAAALWVAGLTAFRADERGLFFAVLGIAGRVVEPGRNRR
jgi:hypothetical protein